LEVGNQVWKYPENWFSSKKEVINDMCYHYHQEKKTIFFRVVFLFAAMLLDLGHTPRICHDQNLNTLYIAEEGVLHL